MPVRTVSNRGGNIIGHFPSLKMQRMIAFESLIERDCLYLLDYEHDVTCFEEQPLTIEYQHEGKALHYTPDFHVIEAGQNVLIECKPHVFVDKDENQHKFHAARTWCATQGWTFRVMTDCDIRIGFRLQNVKLLTRYARCVVRPHVRGAVSALLYSTQVPLAIDEVARGIGLGDPSAITTGILHMAFHHEVFISLDSAPISGRTPVHLYPFKSKEVYL